MITLDLYRIFKGSNYTIGKLYINGEYFCDTMEDIDRNLDSKGNLDSAVKVKHETAIPYGSYKITLKQQSPRFSKYKQYAFCKGYLPRLIDVPLFDGVLIHIGNTAKDSSGCILVGRNKVKGQVVQSTITFKALYEILDKADKAGEEIIINIKR